MEASVQRLLLRLAWMGVGRGEQWTATGGEGARPLLTVWGQLTPHMGKEAPGP